MDMHGISDMRYMHRGYAYVKYRQMFSICIDAAYADGEDMRMPRICRYQACGYAKNMQFYCFFQLRSENLQFEITYDNYLDNCKHSNKLPASFEEYVDIKLQDHRDKLD